MPQGEAFETALAALGDRMPDAVEYHSLAGLTLSHPLTPQLLALDPFSAEYKALVLRLYHDLRGNEADYLPERDERSGLALPADLWRDVSPWSFRDAGFVGEFLLSWGQIMRALALPPNSEATVLEYGSGSGQLLLFLARLGLRVAAVDIDAASLGLLQTQAAAMRLDIRTEQAGFGEGFGAERFDRIVFFEAFHHAIDFVALLRRLRQRLRPGGRLILCGEPVVEAPTPGVPYPWGPRLDGLSVFCIRRHGWMELGFTEAFLVEALHRHGWLVDVRRLPDCPRATTYIATPYVGTPVEVGDALSLGPHEAGWEACQGDHRWTRGDVMARFPLPDQDGPSLVTLAAGNPFPVAIRVALHDGPDYIRSVEVPPGTERLEIPLGRCRQAWFGIQAEGHRPAELWPGSGDQRWLGLMVRGIWVDPA